MLERTCTLSTETLPSSASCKLVNGCVESVDIDSPRVNSPFLLRFCFLGPDPIVQIAGLSEDGGDVSFFLRLHIHIHTMRRVGRQAFVGYYQHVLFRMGDIEIGKCIKVSEAAYLILLRNYSPPPPISPGSPSSS